MGVAEVRRLEQLEDENATLKRFIAVLCLDRAILKYVLRTKVCRPARVAGPSGTRWPSVAAIREHERSSMIFGHEQRQGERRPRAPTVVDQYTRDALGTEALIDPRALRDRRAQPLSGSHRKPAVIHVNNGTEFASRALDAWHYREDVRLDFSRPGKRTDIAHTELFNARVRAALLNAQVLESLGDPEEPLTLWRSDEMQCVHSAGWAFWPEESRYSVCGVQAVYGQSLQIERHQDGPRTTQGGNFR